MTYNIKRTNGDAILVQPGTVDGPANTEANFTPSTDLDLYGRGTLNWGIGVDRNLVHLLENWACGSVPTNVVNGEQQFRPQTSAEVGATGAGVNQPSIGQEWFNTDNGKLYVCYDIGNGTAQDAKWKTAGADPDLYVPKKGGTFTGNIDINKSDPRLRLTATDGTDMWLEMRDPQQKLLLAVDQQAFPAGATNHPYIQGPLSNPAEVDTVILRKSVGSTKVSQMALRDDYVEFTGGTFGVAGANAGKIRTPQTNAGTPGNNYTDGDHPSVVTTKSYVDQHKVSTHGDVMDGNLRIEKLDPQLALEATSGNEANIYFDQANELKARLVMFDNGTSKYFGIRKYDGATNKTNEIRIHNTYIETFGQAGKIRTDETLVGDHPQTLTTKEYVDAISADLSTNYVQNSGDTVAGTYRFGSPNDDTVITNSQFRSTLGSSSERTTIVGPLIDSDIGSGNKTTINGQVAVFANGQFRTQISGPSLTQVTNSDAETQLEPAYLRLEEITTTGSQPNSFVYENGSAVVTAGSGASNSNSTTITGGIVTTATTFHTGSTSIDFNGISVRASSSDFRHRTSAFSTSYYDGSSTISANRRGRIGYSTDGDDSIVQEKHDSSGDVKARTLLMADGSFNFEGSRDDNNHDGFRLWGDLSSTAQTIGYTFWEGSPVAANLGNNRRRGGMMYDLAANEIRLVTEVSASGNLSTASRTQVNLTQDNGIQTNKRFDFACNVWTQDVLPDFSNTGSDRNQRGVAAGGTANGQPESLNNPHVITAEARNGDVWICSGAQPGQTDANGNAFVANQAYMAIGGVWRRITA